MPANLNRKQQREIKAVVERAKKDNGIPQTAQQSILGNLLTNVVSYVIGLLLLVIGGSAIYCIVKALWQSLLILVVLGIATIAAVFLLVWAVMKVENIGESLGAFIRS